MRLTLVVLLFCIATAGCAPGTGPSFATPAPETQEELTAYLLAAAFAAPADEASGYATVLEQILDSAIPSAHADTSVDQSCEPGLSTNSWVNVALNGPSGTFGASGQEVSVDTDKDYCQDSQGNNQTGTDLFKYFTFTAVQASCNWGGTYDMGGVGVYNRNGNSGVKAVSGAFSFDGVQSGTSDCSLNGTNNGGGALLFAGRCTGWSTGFTATPGTACTLSTP